MPGREETTKTRRRHAVELTDAVLENMRRNLEKLKYSTLAPSRYIVYLHSSEYGRLEGILPTVRQQTIRALMEELQALNRAPAWARLVPGFAAPPRVPVENAARSWHVEFVPDADGELQDGDLLIESELQLPALPELGVGEGTRRVTTRVGADGSVTEGRADDRGTEPVRVLARLTYQDDEGPHAYDMVRSPITIGRGRGADRPDVVVAASADVSRLHVRIRHDPATGQFFLIDLSSFGTTLNQRHVPRGYDEHDGARQENGRETPVPDLARIGLADLVYLHFEIAR
jgi:hypothetical protein